MTLLYLDAVMKHSLFGTLPSYPLDACRWQELRRLHLYAQRAYAVQPLVEDNADCLQQLPLQHVSILAGERCDVDDFVAVLNALPDTVTSVCMAGPFRAALKLGLDGSGQVGL